MNVRAKKRDRKINAKLRKDEQNRIYISTHIYAIDCKFSEKSFGNIHTHRKQFDKIK